MSQFIIQRLSRRTVYVICGFIFVYSIYLTLSVAKNIYINLAELDDIIYYLYDINWMGVALIYSGFIVGSIITLLADVKVFFYKFISLLLLLSFFTLFDFL